MQKKTKKTITIITIVIACAISVMAIGAYLIINAFSNMGNCAEDPKELFKYVTSSSPPEYVKNIEGGGYCWQDYSIWLKAESDERFIEELKLLGYRETKWKNIQHHMINPEDFNNKFSSPWEPEKIKNKICLEFDGQNKWGYIVFDPEENVFYIRIFNA
jgi:hypothetical protein